MFYLSRKGGESTRINEITQLRIAAAAAASIYLRERRYQWSTRYSLYSRLLKPDILINTNKARNKHIPILSHLTCIMLDFDYLSTG